MTISGWGGTDWDKGGGRAFLEGGVCPEGGGSTGTPPLMGGRTDTPPSGLGTKKNQELTYAKRWKQNESDLYDLYDTIHLQITITNNKCSSMRAA